MLMKLQLIVPSILIALFISCRSSTVSDTPLTLTVPPASGIIVPEGNTIETRFNPLPGFRRLDADAASYSAFLRKSPLKPHGSPVLYYNGKEKDNHGVYAAVLAMDIGTRDLQQCADAVMRLRAEYLFTCGQAAQIHFNLTNGFRADFSMWMQGYRISVRGRQAGWVKSTAAAADYKALRGFLDFVFTYAGSLSLSGELKPVAWEDMQPGDVLIIGGSPGHAETVMDMAVNAQGRKVFLLSQSYMPAQDIQILHNPSDPDISPWYELHKSPYTVRTPEYDFSTSNLKRWKEE